MLACQRYPAADGAPLSAPIVLLHGWGVDSHVWQPIIPDLCQWSAVWTLDLIYDDGDSVSLIDRIQAQLPEACYLMGWSLGGMLAMGVAATYPQQIQGLVTLATNARFVASAQWSYGLSAAEFADFFARVEQSPERALKRFAALQLQGDEHCKRQSPWLRALPLPNLPHLLPGLRQLATIDHVAVLSEIQCPGMHLYGERDALVPAKVVPVMQARLPTQHQCHVLPGAAHVLHFPAVRITDYLRSFFYTSMAARMDKRKIARSFSRSAHTYDAVAHFQRDVGQRLLQLLPEGVIEPGGTVLDLGCGTGAFAQPLINACCHGHYIGMDIAPGMLTVAKVRAPDNPFVCADAECLPLQSHSVQLIFSNMALQWCHRITQLLNEMYRTLTPGGWCAMTTLGPATLHELKHAWASVDDCVHVNTFIPDEQWRAAMLAQGFEIVQYRKERPVLHYDTVPELLQALKQLGAHNVNAGQRRTLTGRRRIQQLVEHYQTFKVAAGFPASYEMDYWLLRKC